MSTSTTGAGIDLLKTGSPIIDYSSLDREAMDHDLRIYASTKFHDRWTNFQTSEFAIVFLEILTYIGDLIIYQINATIGESHPSTCIRRGSFIAIAKSYDFFLHGPVGATVPVTFNSDVGQLPYNIDAKTFKGRAANGTIFMLEQNASVANSVEVFDMRAGELFDNEVLGTSNGQPGQSFVIPQTSLRTPLLYRNVPGEGNVPDLEIRVGGALWERRRLEADAQSTDEIYFLRTDENEVVTIHFGDNINGKTPANSADVRHTSRIGLNVSSNVNPRTITTIITPLPGLKTITNVGEASGGSPRQSLLEGKLALPASISTNKRAVVRGDFSDVLFASEAPAGVAKASATGGRFKQQIVWVVPDGGGDLSPSLRNDIGIYFRDVKILGHSIDVRRATDITLRIVLDVYVASNYRADDVLARVRSLFVTEVPDWIEAGTGAFDFVNLGLAARDDTGQPQITESRVQNLAETLRRSGVQKIVVRELRTLPVTKLPHKRTNIGNGGIGVVTYLKPRDVPRREFRIRFTSGTSYEVFRRVVGTSTFLTNTKLTDDRGQFVDIPEATSPVALSLVGGILNPDREQDVDFSVTAFDSTGTTVTVTGAGSVFGSAASGDEYYLEVPDGTGVLPASTNSQGVYNSPVEDLSFIIEAGSVPFQVDDIISFDVFPISGDVTLRPDEFPVFARDLTGAAPDFVTNAKTQT